MLPYLRGLLQVSVEGRWLPFFEESQMPSRELSQSLGVFKALASCSFLSRPAAQLALLRR